LAHGYRDVVIFLFAEVGLLEVASYSNDPVRTEVGLLEVASYSDDPVRTSHLELQVSVVRDDHEFGIAWSA
jgi:hypothetical protein